MTTEVGRSHKQILLSNALERQRSDNNSDLTKDKYFEFFCAKSILFDYKLEIEDISEGIIDGYGDGGIDAFYAFHNDELINSQYACCHKRDNNVDIVIIQSKNTNSFKEDAVLKIKEAVKMIFDLSNGRVELAKRFRADIVEKIVKFRNIYAEIIPTRHKVVVGIYYCANADSPHENLVFIGREVEKIACEFANNVSAKFNFMGAAELMNLIQKNLGSGSFVLDLKEAPINPEGGGYLGLATIDSYYNFIRHNGAINFSIFDANVRDYEGSNEVNDGIKDTLEDNSRKEDFWWLNNGVSIIADTINYGNKKLYFTDPQIVNGLQTSFEIFKYISSGGKPKYNQHILIRAVQISENEKASRDRIIRATNSQTKIPSYALRSTQEVHRDIEQYFQDHNLFYDRRRRFYLNQNVPPEKIISINYLAQAFTAICLARPRDARANFKELLQKDSDYNQIFEKPKLPAYKNCILILKSIEEFLSKKKYARGISNIKYHLAYTYIGLIFGKTKVSAEEIGELMVSELPLEQLEVAFNKIVEAVQKNAPRVYQLEEYSKSRDFENECKKIISIHGRSEKYISK
ncbi:AIPR family protein [Deinococcus sp. RIT780]|uniref:AIPR family protein n=1 Tax=Deinococcus sp. RIT780 TaxID=2870472 RepID=UPI001C88F1D7|nr:AIPR family protein [Deinococcus sp. RIT780]MBX8466920.1 AIPR family protein [Deinococcus sp. RIT780]